MCSAAVVLMLAACGRTPEGSGAELSPSPQPPAATTPAAGFDVLITDRDQDVAVHAGQKIQVYLRAGPGMANWGPITSSDELVLAPVVIGVMVPRGVTVAAFEAVGPGHATVSSSAGPDCSPGQACPMYAVLFSVRVTVV